MPQGLWGQEKELQRPEEKRRSNANRQEHLRSDESHKKQKGQRIAIDGGHPSSMRLGRCRMGGLAGDVAASQRTLQSYMPRGIAEAMGSRIGQFEWSSLTAGLSVPMSLPTQQGPRVPADNFQSGARLKKT